MPTYSSPGVYVQEVASGVHPIEGVATSIAGFVGWAGQGPTDKAVLLTSFVDFARQFGGLDPRSYLGYAVDQFFANGGQQAYVVRLVSDGTDGTVAATAASVTITGLTFDSSAAPAPSNVTIATGGSGGMTLSARNPGSWANDYTVQIQPHAGDYSRFDLSVLHTSPATQAKSVVETFPNLSLNPGDAQSAYVVNVVNENSTILTAAMGSPPLAIVNIPPARALPLPPPGTATVSLSGGNDGTVLNPAAGRGSGKFEAALKLGGIETGVHLLDEVPFNLLVVPGEADPDTIAELQAFCVGRRAFLIADSEPTASFATLQAGPDSATVGTNAANSALYFPWLNAPDPQQNKIRAFPPSGFVAGIYAATDSARGVWKAPAGSGAQLKETTGPTASLTDTQMGILNARAVNVIRSFPPQGTLVWGARSLRGSDEAASEWKYVPVRRLALYIESSLYRGTQWVVFEPNDEPLWSQIRFNVGAFMRGLFQQGAFQGMTPQDAYFVQCNAANNPQSDIDRGIVNIRVGFAPLLPAEFVVIAIQQQAGAAAQAAVRHDPYKNFKYRLKWNNQYVAGFNRAGNLARTTEVIDPRAGGDLTKPHEPGQNKFEAIELERGLTYDMSFHDWASCAVNPSGARGVRKDLEFEIYDRAGRPSIVYKIHGCWVSEYRVLPDLDANANAVAIEHIKLENEGWERDTSVTGAPPSGERSEQPVQSVSISLQKLDDV